MRAAHARWRPRARGHAGRSHVQSHIRPGSRVERGGEHDVAHEQLARLGAALLQVLVADDLGGIDQLAEELLEPMQRADNRALVPVGHARNVGKLGPGTPLDDNVDERVRAFVGVLLNLDRQACLVDDRRDPPRKVAQRVEGLPHGDRLDLSRGLAGGGCVLLAVGPRGGTLRLDDEAREKRGEARRLQLIEQAREHELGRQQLVARRHLARDAPLVLDDAILGDVTKPPQHAPHALELGPHHHVLRALDARPHGRLLLLQTQPCAQQRQSLDDLRVGQPLVLQARLHRLELPLEGAHLRVRHLHLFLWGEERRAVGVASVDLPQHLEHPEAGVALAQVGGHLEPNGRERVEVDERHRQHMHLHLLEVRRRPRPARQRIERVAAARRQRRCRARSACHQHIDRVVGRAADRVVPLALLLLATARLGRLLEVDDHAPSPIERRRGRVRLGRRAAGGGGQLAHLGESPRLQEGERVDRLVDDGAQLVT
mmetsp:Transcript_18563/g.48879  ORF Transcript_18563/g.48879 Transcript_18563/m.48879 type:complete len:486 (+) Transcript_18563:341-1798(+)